jgi:large subunit ribosomal protein L29
MKMKEITGFSVEELNKKLKGLRADLFEAKMKNELGQLGNPIEIRKSRRDIARVHTALAQKLAE